jgi:plastocyanin
MKVLFMRYWLTLVGVVLVVTGARAVPLAPDLHGSIQAHGRPEPEAIVWLEYPGAPSSPQARVILDQRNTAFSPRVLAVRVGTTVEFPNNDRVFHNVFSFHNGKKFDLGLYPVGASRKETFNHPGLSRVFCNIHPNMAAYIMVVDTPYFAVSDSSGKFVIAGVEAGSYTYHVWRPSRSELTGTTVVQAGRALTFEWR